LVIGIRIRVAIFVLPGTSAIVNIRLDGDGVEMSEHAVIVGCHLESLGPDNEPLVRIPGREWETFGPIAEASPASEHEARRAVDRGKQ
jgi:hypothetical protein